MNIDFGIVKKYFSDKGFGFVTHTFLNENQPEIFFHITNIKNSHSDLAEKLNNSKPTDTICFWYESEHTAKGEQLSKVIKSDVIQNIDFDNLPSILEKVENTWNDLDSSIPIWLCEVTLDLVGEEQANQISSERELLENEHKEKERKKYELLREVEQAKYKKLIEDQKIQDEIETKEFEQLVAEMKSLGITHSNQVSKYITDNQLGSKYKNISGIVQMEQEGTIWKYEGGFPRKIYARLCSELGLHNQGSRARAVGFTPFKDL